MSLTGVFPAGRAVLGFVLVFLLPGFAWTLVFFPKLSAIERGVLSFALSIALVVLSIIAVNVALGVRISGLSSLVVIFVLTIVPLAIYYLRKRPAGS